MATDKEYKAVIDALSGECERLHKENEELKKALENHDTFMKYAYLQGKQDALSQEPCEDCISRQAVLDGLASIAKAKAKSDAQKSLMGRVMSFTEHLPSATQKSGKWIEQEGWDGDVYYECSVCGEPFCLIEGTPTDNMYNYCSNCGTKMESEDKE